MPSIIVIKYTENAGMRWKQERNEQYPAPDWKANVNITVDIDGRMMFEQAGMGVGFTGVMNVKSGRISLTAVVPREAEVEHDIGGFRRGYEPDKRTGKTKMMARGPETEAFQQAPKAMKLLGFKFLTPIKHGDRFGTSHEQLAKDAEGIDRNVGKGKSIPDEENYIGFTITKWEGSAAWPHEIVFRSGTFNQRFVKGGIGIPNDWARLIQGALEQLLPDQPVQTRRQRTVTYRQGQAPTGARPA